MENLLKWAESHGKKAITDESIVDLRSHFCYDDGFDPVKAS